MIQINIFILNPADVLIWQIFQTDFYIVLIFQTEFQDIELQDTYHTHNNLFHTGIVLLKNLNRTFLRNLGNTFDEPDCCFIPFCKDKLVIATPVNQHYLQYQQKMDSGTLDFSDFLREPFIMRETGSGTKKEIDRYLEKRNIPASSLHIVARMNDLEAIRKSVAGGLGISILSACSAKDLADTHQILMFPLNHESAMRTFYIVYSKNRILKPHVKQFLKFVTNFY